MHISEQRAQAEDPPVAARNPPRLRSLAGRIPAKPAALIALWLLGILCMFMRLNTRFTAKTLDIDASWFLELENQLRMGNLLGRDVHFTYGPLAQLLMSAEALLRGGGPALNGYALGLFVFNVAAVSFLLLAIGLIKPIGRGGAVFIFAVCLALPGVIYLRPLFSLLTIAVLVRTLDAPAPYRRWLGVGVGLLLFAGQLLSMDLVIYQGAAALALLLGCAALALIQERAGKRRIDLLPPRAYLAPLAAIAATLLVCNALLEVGFRASSASYHGFDYLRASLAIVRGYSYAMGLTWLFDALPTAALVLMIVYTIASVLARLRSAERGMFHLLLGLSLIALVHFKGALVRSDAGHITTSSSLLAFLFLLMIYLTNDNRFRQLIGVALLALLVFAWSPSYLKQFDDLSQLIAGATGLAQKWREARASASPALEIAPPDLRAAVDPRAGIVDFPYDNVIAMALGQPSVAPILQPYAAFDERLQTDYVDQLRARQAQIEIVYGMDRLVVDPTGGVQYVTRLPRIFAYIYENFRLKTNAVFRRGYVVLAPRAQPRPLAQTPIAYDARASGGALDLALRRPASCALLAMDVTMRYPATAALGRPNDLTIQVRNGARTLVKSKIIAVEPKRQFTTFLYIGPTRRFYQLFGDGDRPGPVATFDRVSVAPSPGDIFSVDPSSFDVTNLRCAA